MNGYTWSLGTLIWVPVAALLTIAALVGGWIFLRVRRNADEYDRGPILFFAIVCWICAAVIVIGTAVGMWPYRAEYHQWRETSGVVTSVDSRLIAEDHGTTQRFVVNLAGVGQRACDDTRCSQVKVGDTLTLSCKRAWQWAATPGWDCNWVGLKRGNR